VSEPAARRRPSAVLAPPVATEAATEPPPRTPRRLPFLLDFFPLEAETETRLARFFARLKEGHLSTTRCPKDGRIDWPPRVACPRCHTEELEWVDLPDAGRIYAFSAILGGAPIGMEEEVPFAVGLVDLEGTALRLYGRIEGRPWGELAIGMPVRVEPYDIGDGRYFFRFRASA
jgi:uncharacterized protein